MTHPLLKKIGHVQTILILSILYFIIGGFVVLLMKIFRYDPLQAKKTTDSFWNDRKYREMTLDNYYYQF